MALRAARAWGERPTVFLGYNEPGGPWSARDRELARALFLYEGSLCSGCGLDANTAQDPDREGWVIVDVSTCAGCKARDVEAKSSGSEPGVKYRLSFDPDYVKRS